MSGKIAVIGSGAREHALVAALGRSGQGTRILTYPGNDGMEGVERRGELPPDPESGAQVLSVAGVDLAIIGPEKPLMDGLGNALRERGIPVVGPNFEAARIEGSKIFAKELMQRVGIPTAPWMKVSGRAEAEELLGRWGLPLVFKADGLAQGKGVTVVTSMEDWEIALFRYFDRKEIPGGEAVLVERGLSGPEVSFIVLTDGRKFVPFPTARDYKRIFDSDRGPNTGGMGALTPVPGWTSKDQERSMEIIERCLWGLSKVGTPFSGFLYAGLMMTEEGPSVLEFNSRMGDPEAQVLFETLGDMALPLLEEVAGGAIVSHWALPSVPRVGVVLASKGYPDKPVLGDPIEGLPHAEGVLPDGQFYYAGVKRVPGALVSSGGRVLTAVGRGESLESARRRAYHLIEGVRLSGGHYRTDIAKKESESPR
jgi:phosphoribosylamine--glycine ligase